MRKAVFEIKDLFRKHGMDLWVEGVIVFTNPEVRVVTRKMKDIRVLRLEDIGRFFEERRDFLNEKALEKLMACLLGSIGGMGKWRDISKNGLLIKSSLEGAWEGF